MGEELLLLLIGSIFIAIAICISKFKWYFLISGYNTMSKEEKGNVDIEGLAKYISRMSYIISVLCFMAAMLHKVLNISIWIFFIAMVAVIFYFLWFIQRFDHNKRYGNETKVIIIFILAIMLMVNIPIVIISYKAPEIIIKNNYINVSGGTNITIPKEKVKSIDLVEKMPEILLRTNGVSIGRIRKGSYKLEGDLKAQLFITGKDNLYIEIITDEDISHYYINYKNGEDTIEAYNKLKEDIQE